MLDELKKTHRIVIGTKQVLKAGKAGQLVKAFIAEDADSFIKNKLQTELSQYGVAMEATASMKELGEACGIQVGSAAAGILK
jgi:large subunit ribosomal protein L7A